MTKVVRGVWTDAVGEMVRALNDAKIRCVLSVGVERVVGDFRSLRV